MGLSALILVLGISVTAAQQFQCPHEFGYYAHEVACDQYYSCEAGIPTVKTCGNGLAFDDSDLENLKESCDYIYNVDCSTRPERQAAIATANCPYLYGIFPDPDDCQIFWSCWNGEASRYQCGPSLAYDPRSRICTWMDKVPECKTQLNNEINNYECPAGGSLTATGAFTRHAHPEDCRQYYVCMDGVPREYGCPIGTVFNIGQIEGQGECKSPKIVAGCEDYYGDLDLTSLKTSQHLGNLGLAGGNAPVVAPTIPNQPIQRSSVQRSHHQNQQEHRQFQQQRAQQSQRTVARPVVNNVAPLPRVQNQQASRPVVNNVAPLPRVQNQQPSRTVVDVAPPAEQVISAPVQPVQQPKRPRIQRPQRPSIGGRGQPAEVVLQEQPVEETFIDDLFPEEFLPLDEAPLALA